MDKKNGYYIKHISIGGKSITVRGRTQAEIREKLAKKLLKQSAKHLKPTEKEIRRKRK